MLIGLTGFKQSGKSTAEALLKQKGFETYSFATPIKETIEFLTGIPYEVLDSQETKETALTDGVFNRLDKPITPRLLLTTLGTEWGRNLIHPNIWVELAQDRIDLTKDTVISDLRFQSEVDFVRRNNGIIIHILKEPDSRFKKLTRLIKFKLGMLHESELGITPGPNDLIIYNCQSLSLFKYNLELAVDLIKTGSKNESNKNTVLSIRGNTFKINEFLLSTEYGGVMFKRLNKDLLKHNIELYEKDKAKKRNISTINRKAKRLFRYLAENKRNIKLSLDMKEIKADHFKLIIQEKTIVVYYHYNETPEEMETLYIVIDSDNDEFYKQVILTFNSGTGLEYRRTLRDLLVDIQWLRY